MGNVNSTIYASQSYSTMGNMPDGAKSLVNIKGTYTLVGTETAGDVIKIAKIPAFADVKPQLSTVFSENPGAALVVKIGTNISTASFNSELTMSAGGQFTLGDTTLEDAVYETEYDLQAVISTATTLTAGAEMAFDVVYSKK